MADNSRIMKAGNGPESYFRNSNLQRNALEQAKALFFDGIVDSLELPSDSRVFTIADLGCSVGPNTFSCVATIIEAVKHKFDTVQLPEFQVLFNDQVANDFNTLFKSLPPDRQYMAAGVPGSFHGRLFPKSSVNLMSSSIALHWLSKVPEGVTKRNNPEWNKGRITYARSSGQVLKAFRDQFYSDITDFLSARTEELVPGGILGILLPCRSQGTSPSKSIGILIIEILADALADMVTEGIISEELVDSFNIPMFIPDASELKEIVLSSSNTKHLIIERVEEVHFPTNLKTPHGLGQTCSNMRAVVEGVFCQHFGRQVADEVFRRYPEKIENLVNAPDSAHLDKWNSLFMLLKRNHNDA